VRSKIALGLLSGVYQTGDDTPGCTAQACRIRDAYADFETAGAVVLGVSPDRVVAKVISHVKPDTHAADVLGALAAA